jgi:tripartite-type tricarboxylate transporter receptor subunit TctC
VPKGLRRHALLVAALVAVCSAPTPTPADPTADFYRGKTISVLIGVGAGGEYDTIARLVARYIGRYIHGQIHARNPYLTGFSEFPTIPATILYKAYD